MADGERIEVTVGERDVERLNWMMEVADIGTREELFATALEIMGWVVQERREGRTVLSVGMGDDDVPHHPPKVLGSLDAGEA